MAKMRAKLYKYSRRIQIKRQV